MHRAAKLKKIVKTTSTKRQYLLSDKEAKKCLTAISEDSIVPDAPTLCAA